MVVFQHYAIIAYLLFNYKITYTFGGIKFSCHFNSNIIPKQCIKNEFNLNLKN